MVILKTALISQRRSSRHRQKSPVDYLTSQGELIYES
jgi:hypothetical protein